LKKYIPRQGSSLVMCTPRLKNACYNKRVAYSCLVHLFSPLFQFSLTFLPAGFRTLEVREACPDPLSTGGVKRVLMSRTMLNDKSMLVASKAPENNGQQMSRC
ncbi:hypothetical protein GOP47_0006672, partial [Adiantum capillus-veneris]